MGKRGPIPERSEQRVRRNKTGEDGIATEKITAIGQVGVPELGLSDPHPLISDFYESLKASAQSQYYEESDWQFARITCHFLDQQIKAGRPSAQMYAAVNTALSNLLVSEGDRRRVRLEIERETKTGQVVDVAEFFRERMASGQ